MHNLARRQVWIGRQKEVDVVWLDLKGQHFTVEFSCLLTKNGSQACGNGVLQDPSPPPGNPHEVVVEKKYGGALVSVCLRHRQSILTKTNVRNPVPAARTSIHPTDESVGFLEEGR